MTTLPLLVVTVLAAGGPPGTGGTGRPAPLRNATITVIRHSAPTPRLLARVRGGSLRLHVHPGVYTLEASLGGAHRGVRCSASTVTIRPGTRTRRVSLYCPVSRGRG